MPSTYHCRRAIDLCCSSSDSIEICYFVHIKAVFENKRHIGFFVRDIISEISVVELYRMIDDEKFPEKNQLAYLSVFNNRQKAFLKNPNRYRCDYGPFFYSVRDNLMISKMTEFFDNLRKTPACSRYGYKELQAFYDNYASMINRMIDL